MEDDAGSDLREDPFQRAWKRAANIPGWLTEAQARRLWDEASKLSPSSRILEIGSHRGRSTTVLGLAVERRQGRVVAIDPFVEGRLFGGGTTRDEFEANIAGAELGEVVQLVRDYSTKLRPRWNESLDLLYIDGKHDYWTCTDDFKWSVHLPPEGVVLVHDAFSSIGVTLCILAKVLPSRRLSYEGRSGSLATFRRRSPTLRDRARIVRELPWWARNIVIKILLRSGLKALTPLLGHEGEYDPF